MKENAQSCPLTCTCTRCLHAYSVLKRGKEMVERDKSEGRLGISILDWVGGEIVIEASQMCFALLLHCYISTF